MNIDAVKQLIRVLEESTLNSLTYKDETLEISLSKGEAVFAAPPQRTVQEQTIKENAPAAAPETKSGVQVLAPVVGSVYRAREPGLPPLVNVGDSVKEKDPLCLIEAMKMFREITSPCNGVVKEIAFSDGELAEYGTLLMVIEPT